MKKMGRPISQNPKKYRMGFRLTEDEYQIITAYCNIHNITITELIKKIVIKKIKEDDTWEL